MSYDTTTTPVVHKREVGKELISKSISYRKGGGEKGEYFVDNYHYYDSSKKSWVRLQTQNYYPEDRESYVQFSSEKIDVSAKTKVTGSIPAGLGYAAAAGLLFSSSGLGLLGGLIGGVRDYFKRDKARIEDVAQVESGMGKVDSSYSTANVWGKSYTELIKTADLPANMYWAKSGGASSSWEPVYISSSFKNTNYALTASREGLNPRAVEERKSKSTMLGALYGIGTAIATTNVFTGAVCGIARGLYSEHVKKKESQMQRYELV